MNMQLTKPISYGKISIKYLFLYEFERFIICGVE